MKIIHGYVYTENAGFVQKDIQIQGNLHHAEVLKGGQKKKKSLMQRTATYFRGLRTFIFTDVWDMIFVTEP